MGKLRVGSDCAGMATELFALQALGIEYEQVFCSEIDEHAVRFLRHNHKCKTYFHDMTDRDMASVPPCDLYVCSFPCQPWSVLNLRKNKGDARRSVVDFALEYIHTHAPSYWVMENVAGILHTDGGKPWRALCERFDALADYLWSYQVLCPSTHASGPQNRKRVFMAGVHKRAGTRVDFPGEVPLTRRCVDLLDPHAAGQPCAPCYTRMLREIWKVPPDAEGIVEFCSASRAYSPYKDPRALKPHELKHVLKADVCSALIKHDPGHFANHLGRMLTNDESLRLMGFEPSVVRVPSITPTQMRSLCGNAMHMGVLARVLAHLMGVPERAGNLMLAPSNRDNQDGAQPQPEPQ